MIELQDISKLFNKGRTNEVAALNHVNLRIDTGEYVVIIGANGSGKTTLLNVIAGAERATRGRVLIDDHDVTALAEHRRSRWISRVFQNPYAGTASDLTILDNFRLAALRTHKKNMTIGINPAFRQKVQDLIAKLGMGLENKVGHLMGELSGGQRQALTMLMSVMDKASVLLLDEPTAALDPKSAAMVLSLADQLIREYRLTALFITHNLKEGHNYGSRLIQFQQGAIVRDIPTTEKSTLSLPDMYRWFE